MYKGGVKKIEKILIGFFILLSFSCSKKFSPESVKEYERIRTNVIASIPALPSLKTVLLKGNPVVRRDTVVNSVNDTTTKYIYIRENTTDTVTNHYLDNEKVNALTRLVGEEVGANIEKAKQIKRLENGIIFLFGLILLIIIIQKFFK